MENGLQDVAAITVFPDPTNGTVIISSALHGPVELRVLDHLGRLLRMVQVRINADGPVLLDLAELPPGAYVIRLRANDRVATRMVVLE